MERPHFDIVASGARMKMIRQQRNISVKQVMEYMGFESTQAVYKWEAGKCCPRADNLIALTILYRVSPLELLVEEDVASSSCWLWGYLEIIRSRYKRHSLQYILNFLEETRNINQKFN